jgi:hypothetical protein
VCDHWSISVANLFATLNRFKLTALYTLQLSGGTLNTWCSGRRVGLVIPEWRDAGSIPYQRMPSGFFRLQLTKVRGRQHALTRVPNCAGTHRTPLVHVWHPSWAPSTACMTQRVERGFSVVYPSPSSALGILTASLWVEARGRWAESLWHIW